MGWASGSTLMAKVISAIQPKMPDAEARKSVYGILIDAFEDMDWDTQNECLDQDPAFDEALRERYPGEYPE
jgi:hypothetical protein